MKKVSLTVIPFILLLIGNAQQFNPIQVKGLPTGSLYDLFADSKGFVWIAHEMGISRYDGNNFSHFNCDQQTSLAMTDIQEDKQGKIWCHNFNGQLFYIINEKMYLLQAYDNAKESGFPRIMVLNNELLATSDHGLFVCNTASMACKKILTSNGLGRSKSIAIIGNFAVTAGDNWYTYKKESGLHLLKADTKLCAANFILQPFITKDTIYAIENINGSLNAGKLVVRNDSIILVERILKHSLINTICQDEGKIWINTKKETSTSDGNMKAKGFDLSDRITDREGNHWYSSLQKGLLFERSIGNWQTVDIPKMQIDEYVKCIIGYKKLVVYGTNKGRIIRRNIESGKVISQVKIPNYMGSIKKLINYGNDNLIVASSFGFSLFNLDNGYFKTISNHGILKNLAFTDRLCVIAYADSLTAFPLDLSTRLFLNGKRKVEAKQVSANLISLLKKEKCIRRKWCRDVCYDSSGHLLYATFMDGLFLIENAKFKPLKYKTGTAQALSLTFIKNKIITTSFNKGLFFINKKQLRPFTQIKALVPNTITSLKIYGQYLILIGTNKMQLLDLLNDTLLNIIPLPNDFTADVNSMEISGNKFFMAKPSGLYSLDLDSLKYTNMPKPVNYLLSATANSKKNILNHPSLNTEENNLLFTFATPNYTFPENTFFYYQLKGSSDSGWRKMHEGEHSLSFASLEPGNYILNAYAVNYRLQKAPSPLSFKFSIDKPWWQHLWFVILLFVITTLIIYIIILLRFRYVRSKIKEKELRQQQFETQLLQSQITIQEQERKRIAEDLHDDIGATLSALHLHISNIPNRILQTSPELQKFYAQSLSLASKAATDVRGISHDLLPKDFAELGLFSVLQNRIDELNATNAIQFTFITDGNEKQLDNNYSVTIYRIINELISNIIKHSQAQKALIQILINETEIQIIAEDNGIGILTEKLGVGIGMKNIQSRVSFLKGILNIDSSEKGTAIIINIPANNG